MQPLDPDRDTSAAVEFDQHLPPPTIGDSVPADPIALRRIRIEIVLAIEHRAQVDLRIQAEASAHRLPDAFLVDHGQHARHRRVDQRNVAVRLTAEFGRRA